MQGKERLDLADDFPAGGVGFEHLVEEAEEGAAHGVDPLAAIGALVGLREQAWGQQGSQEQLQVAEALLAEGLDPAAQGGQAGAPVGEERRMHDKYIYLFLLDGKDKIVRMKKKSEPGDALPFQYQRLCASLANLGYISQGSVVDRSQLRPPRSGYQWTRKVARKTITVALSREQFLALRTAIQNRRALQKTLATMEKLSRQILFGTLPDTRRRKPLPMKVLGTN